jgi:hypothetical protein
MPVTTFEDFYNLVKNNIVYFQYQKDNIVFNFKGTLLPDLIPRSDENLTRYDYIIKFSDYHIGQWVGTDSDEANILYLLESDPPAFGAPGWLKIYCMNHDAWFNIEIDKIVSLEVVDS